MKVVAYLGTKIWAVLRDLQLVQTTRNKPVYVYFGCIDHTTESVIFG